MRNQFFNIISITFIWKFLWNFYDFAMFWLRGYVGLFLNVIIFETFFEYSKNNDLIPSNPFYVHMSANPTI